MKKVKTTQESVTDVKWTTLVAVLALVICLLVLVVVVLVNKGDAKEASQAPTSETSVITQPTYAGKVGEVRRQDGVTLVEVILTEGPILEYRETAIAGTNLVVGDSVRLVWVYTWGGKNFPVARLIGMTNSLP